MGEYYEQRAEAGIIMTEATSVSEDGSGWRNAPHIRTPEHAAAWKSIVDRVHAKDGIIYLQLWHIGRQSHSSFHPTTNRIVSASALPMEGGETKATFGMAPAEVPHELTVEEIKETIADFVNGAKLAKEAGFDGVALHSANGYLLVCVVLAMFTRMHPSAAFLSFAHSFACFSRTVSSNLAPTSERISMAVRLKIDAASSRRLLRALSTAVPTLPIASRSA